MGYIFPYKKILASQIEYPLNSTKNISTRWVITSHSKSSLHAQLSQTLSTNLSEISSPRKLFFQSQRTTLIQKPHDGSFKTKHRHTRWLQLGHVVGTSAKCHKNIELLGCHKGRSGGPCYNTTNVQSVDPTNGTDTNKCRPASRRTSIVEQEEQHCPWCNTRKNKLGNLVRVCKSRGRGHTLDRLGNEIWQSRGGHYLSLSSKPIQSSHDGFISIASPNSGLPRKLHADFSKRSLQTIRGHCYIYILLFSSNIILRPRITISHIDRGYHQVRVAKNHCTGHQRRVSAQSADQRSRIRIANP